LLETRSIVTHYIILGPVTPNKSAFIGVRLNIIKLLKICDQALKEPERLIEFSPPNLEKISAQSLN